MALSNAVALIKAAAEPTRLRLLALLSGGEATVGELVEILGQSQPRVSRHLKLLTDARLLNHFRDGHWVYYRLSAESAAPDVIAQVIELARAGDELLESDKMKLSGIRRRRERYAHELSTGPRHLADPVLDRPADAEIAQALNEALGTGPLGDVLDIGTGSGTLLRLVGSRARNAVGLDAARGMRVLARTRVQEAGLAHCTIRGGDMHELPFPDHAFDVVILDEVLSLSSRPAVALREALRALRPAGRLLILDRIQPAARRLPNQLPERGLYENQLAVLLHELGLKLVRRTWFPGRTLEHALFTAAVAASPGRTGTDD